MEWVKSNKCAPKYDLARSTPSLQVPEKTPERKSRSKSPIHQLAWMVHRRNKSASSADKNKGLRKSVSENAIAVKCKTIPGMTRSSRSNYSNNYNNGRNRNGGLRPNDKMMHTLQVPSMVSTD